jgi:flagellar basal body-associated protein FliL
MKRIVTPSSYRLLIAYRITVLLIFVLTGILIAGTIYAFLRSPGSGPLFRIGGSGAAATEHSGSGAAPAGNNDTVSVFTGIGRLRIPLSSASGSAATLIISIAFPYPPEDRAFTEELASKIGEFRALASGYFSALPAEKLVSLDEEAAKTEILRRYNTSLRLGKIGALYFSDLLIIE